MAKQPHSHQKNLIFLASLAILLLFPTTVHSQQSGLLSPLLGSARIYCSSMCADYIDACTGPTSQECLACDANFFNLNSQDGVCQSVDQKIVILHQLKTQSMSLEGYQTSNPESVSCGGYSLSGDYVAGDYLAKKFKIPESYGGHYELTIKFGIGYIGSWSDTDTMSMKINNEQYAWNYSCSEPTQQCSSSSIDCMKFITRTIKHDEGDLTFNISSSIAETDPLVKYWGIREMIIIMKTCASSCAQCYGPLSSQCLVCEEGFYLLGNSCVRKCPFMKVQKSHYCVQSCPQGFYTQNQVCKECNPNCISCSNGESCIIYTDGSTSESFLSKNLLSFIILIVLLVGLVGILIWKFVFDRLNKKVSDGDNGINDRIIDGEIVTENDSDKKNKDEKKLETNQSRISQEHNFSSIKFDKEFPNQINEKTFEDLNAKWMEPIQEGSQAYLNTQKVRKRRNGRKKRQQINNASCLEIRNSKKKDQVDDYFEGTISINNNQL